MPPRRVRSFGRDRVRHFLFAAVVGVVLVILGARLLVVGAPFGPLLILLGSALIAPVLPRKAS